MRRRLRLMPTFLAICLAIVMLGFGVYAVLNEVTYDISGNISYIVTDTYVEVNTKIYKSDTYLTKGELADTVEQIANLSFADIEAETNLEHISYLDDTYSSLEDFSGTAEYSKSDDLHFNFVTNGEDKVFAYYIVINVVNLTENDNVYAVMQDDIIDVENTFQYNNALQENILNGEDNRNMVIGIIVDDITTPIAENSPFSYGINIASGDVARSEQMTAKYNASTGYKNAKGVIVIDPSVNAGSFTGISNNKNITALFVRDGIDEVKSCSSSSLKKVVLADGVTSIENYAFRDCEGLTSITIPDSVTSIGVAAFSGCDSLTTILVADGNTKYTSQVNGEETNCIIEIREDSVDDTCRLIQGCKNSIILDGITSIGAYAFSDCTGLATITIPDSVASIGRYAFSSCTSLTSITIPDSVTSIGVAAFSGCDSLTTILVADGNTKYTSQVNGEETNCIIEIREDSVDDTCRLIQGCKNSIILDGITSIGAYAFSDCTGLATITIPDSVTSIGESVFSHCTSLTSITIPGSVGEIGNYAFNECFSLASVTLGNGVMNIDHNVFFLCINLTSITIPDSVRMVGYEVFAHCEKLTKVTIPASVERIGDHAFSGCSCDIYINMTEEEVAEKTWDKKWNADFTGTIHYLEEYLNFKLIENGNDDYYAVGVREESVKDIENWGRTLVIPSEYQGLPVRKIVENAFSGCTSLTSITIPASVELVGEYAFEGCSCDIYIDMTEEEVSEKTWDKKWNADFTGVIHYSEESGEEKPEPTLDYLEFELIENGNDDYYSVYINETAVTEAENWDGAIVIPTEFKGLPVRMVSDKGFDCSEITNVIIPNSVTSIGYSAFDGCKYLTNVTIPNSVTSIGEYAFAGCSCDIYIDMTEEEVAEKTWDKNWNADFTGTIHYSDEVQQGPEPTLDYLEFELIENGNDDYYSVHLNETAVKEAENWDGAIVIPAEYKGLPVRMISDKGFAYSEIISIVIPNSVTIIEDCAFTECMKLESIVIPDSVLSIGTETFFNCANLSSIYMKHANDNLLNLGEDWSYKCTVYYYSETEKSGYWHYDGNNNPVLW